MESHWKLEPEKIQQERGTSDFIPAQVFKILIAYPGYDYWKYIKFQGDEGERAGKWPEKRISSSLFCFSVVLVELINKKGIFAHERAKADIS